mgnify:CR=1 FL=1
MPSRSGERNQYRAIYTDATPREREENFEDYLAFTRAQDGELFEAEKDLAAKREQLRAFQAAPVRSRRPLVDPEQFYRNHVVFRDDPATIDRVLAAVISNF